jgi:small GTP-binding protein
MITKKRKIVFLGESTTGKTTMAYRLINKQFNFGIESTIGAGFMLLTLDGINYEIWDTAGQERYLSLVEMYYRNCDIAILVFNLAQPKTVERLNYYLFKIAKDLNGNFKILIVGNKLDLIKKTDLSEIDTYLKDKIAVPDILKNHLEYVNISAKTGENFEEFVQKISEFGRSITKYEHFDKGIVELNTVNQDQSKDEQCYC